MTLMMLASNGLLTLLMMVAVFLVFTTLASRPLKKQQQQAAEMRSQLTEGERVVLTSGLFGTITHVGNEQLVIELAPGTEVTALKTAVTRVVAAGDEEFSFADDEDDLADEVEAPVADAPAAPDAPADPVVDPDAAPEQASHPDFAAPIPRAN